MTLPQNVKDAMDIDYAPGELDRTAPERIWLQVDTNGDNNDRDEPWSGDDASWCAESIGGLEIQYARADLLRAHPLNQEAEIADLIGKRDFLLRHYNLAESRLAAANALLLDALPFICPMGEWVSDARVPLNAHAAMCNKIQSHLQGAGDE